MRHRMLGTRLKAQRETNEVQRAKPKTVCPKGMLRLNESICFITTVCCICSMVHLYFYFHLHTKVCNFHNTFIYIHTNKWDLLWIFFTFFDLMQNAPLSFWRQESELWHPPRHSWFGEVRQTVILVSLNKYMWHEQCLNASLLLCTSCNFSLFPTIVKKTTTVLWNKRTSARRTRKNIEQCCFAILQGRKRKNNFCKRGPIMKEK